MFSRYIHGTKINIETNSLTGMLIRFNNNCSLER